MSNNIVKHDQLKDIAGDLWTKAKKRDIERFEFDSTTKTLKGKNLGDTTLSIDVALTDLVSINDRAKFKQDVSVDDAKAVSNSNIGSINGTVAAGSRTTGYRGLTSKLFTDGYVKLLRIYLPTNIGNTINAHVWMIKKGASKAEDKFLEPKIIKAAPVLTSGANKYIDVEIEREFAEETFFVLRTEGNQPIQGINNIKQEFRDDIINVDAYFNPQSTDTLANWNRYNPIYDSVGHMELHGRTGIVDISKRLDEIDTASGNYVLQSETTTTGGNSNANKVARLDNNGKLNADMLPSIAINEYVPASAFTHEALRQLEFQNGDIVVVTANGKVTRYLCVDKAGHLSNLTEAFIPLNDKDGIVFSVNEQRPGANGNVTVTAEHIKYDAGSTKNVKQVLDEKVSNITLKANDKKKLEITKATGVTSDVDLTEAFKANNVAYNKQIAGTNKATVDDALDALSTEVNKGIKTIKGGSPGTNGDMNVTVAESGATGITMTFGTTGGTPVQIATYMTTDEVNQIKALFT